MSDISFDGQMTVKLIRAMADDEYVVQAAQVSAIGENNPGTDVERLINALMKDRHGSPFEHGSFTFFVKAPLFVVREWQRHRMSSFNEMSGRYTVLPGEFYIPDPERPLQNKNTKMRPLFKEGSTFQKLTVRGELERISTEAWGAYQYMLASGVATEVARMALPLNIYTQMYWTVNPRSLMNFLSLRVSSDESLVKSYPQLEIQQAAELVEAEFKHWMPYTHAAFIKNGRVAP